MAKKDNRVRLVTVRMTSEERELISLVAKHNGESLGGVLRRIVIPELRKAAKAVRAFQSES